MRRSRVIAGSTACASRARSSAAPKSKVEDAIRTHLKAGNGILKIAAMVGCGSGTVQRVKRKMTPGAQA